MKRSTLASLLFLAFAVAFTGIFGATTVEARGARKKESVRQDDSYRQEDILSRGNKPWYFYYNTGLEAKNRGDWKRAKDNFLLAISVDPEPGRKKRTSGPNFQEYYPYLEAARSYYNLGEIAEAEKFLRMEEDKNVAPKDMIGALQQLIIEGRKEPMVFLYTIVEQTSANFVDIKGIAFDYHNIDKLTIGDREVAGSTLRDATIDERKALPYEPKLGFTPLSTKYFEVLGYPLTRLGENRIPIRAYATNPDRKSALLELVIFRMNPKTAQAPAAAAPAEAEAAPAE